MVTILFWNLFNKTLLRSIENLAFQHTVDMIILAECAIDPTELLIALNQHAPAAYHFAPSPGCTKIRIFTKFSAEYLPIILEDERLTIRELRKPNSALTLLLAALHFPSQLYSDEFDQSAQTPIYTDLIRRAEELAGHQRTLVIGDFNMNPFSRGMVQANGFHGVMSRQIAQKRSRTIRNQDYPFFYNPMWSLLGDATPGPSGTYYYNPSNYASYYWHMFDQVLLRPDLLDSFENQNLQILDADGKQSLLTRSGQPDKENRSDHLPILLKLNI